MIPTYVPAGFTCAIFIGGVRNAVQFMFPVKFGLLITVRILTAEKILTLVRTIAFLAALAMRFMTVILFTERIGGVANDAIERMY
ncbi:MAG: hypothetical protein J6Z25_00805 [Opitutales bacterium]|nr:hypothetical protein [Opitutales bacterium]